MSDSPYETPTYKTGDLDRIEAALVGDRATVALKSHPTAIGRYRILNHIGEGGMGCVYRAQQHAPIERIVALKLIKAGLDSPEVIRRFESERQALAWMDHPHIAKVLDAGADPVSGRPYFVMEFVGGAPITRYCDEHRLNNRQRLALFLQVCDAVAHAHQKMIVHRDLKPSNILISSTNGPSTAQAKVIDFGVAKALVTTSDARTMYTEVGQVIGTPEYMSPEQARGACGGNEAGVDTRSDIYSLGVVLYELISGSLPFDSRELRSSGFAGIERMICDIDPPRPSTRLSKLSGDLATRAAERRQTRVDELLRELESELDWIPLKAMRKDRAERYATANALADDVRNYLAGRPLIAAPESRTYRAKKFLRRNRRGVAALVAMVLLLIAGIVATSVQAVRAERQRKLAEQQRALAENRFDDIRNFSANLINDIHGDVAKLPGSQPAVEKLINVALQYLQKLEAEASDNVDVVIDASMGYDRLGDMQGGSRSNNKGDVNAARASYEKSRQLAQRALQLAPDNTAAMNALATADLKLADLATDAASYVEAQQLYESSLRLLEQIAAAAPLDFTARYNVANALFHIASLQTLRQDAAGALKVFETLVAQTRQLIADFPREPTARKLLASALWDFSDLRLRSGDGSGAEALALEAASFYVELVPADPHNVGLQVNQSQLLESLARIQEHNGKMDDAIATQSRSRQIAAELYLADPKNARVRGQLAGSELRSAELASRTDKFDVAQAGFDRAIALFNEALAQNPADRSSLQLLCYAHAATGDMFAKQKRYPEAMARHREVIKVITPIAQAEPDNLPMVGGLAYGQMMIAQIATDAGDVTAALDASREAISINERIISRDPANAAISRQLIEARLLLGDALAATKQPNDARAAYTRARDEAVQLAAKNQLPPNDDIVEKLAARLANLLPADR